MRRKVLFWAAAAALSYIFLAGFVAPRIEIEPDLPAEKTSFAACMETGLRDWNGTISELRAECNEQVHGR